MTVDEINQLLGFAGAFGIGGVVSGMAIVYLLKSYVPSYLSEKAKNLATREDIARITHEVERVKAQYAALIEELKAKHQLRLAAVDRRLQTHQEAFTLWRELIKNAHENEIGAVVLKCQDWWEKNCLFLEPEAREAFSLAYSAANSHNALLAGGRNNVEAVRENWKKITNAGEVILRATQLPGLTAAEREELGDVGPNPGGG